MLLASFHLLLNWKIEKHFPGWIETCIPTVYDSTAVAPRDIVAASTLRIIERNEVVNEPTKDGCLFKDHMNDGEWFTITARQQERPKIYSSLVVEELDEKA